MMTQNADKKREQIQMFCMDDMVPQDYLLRIIDKAINWNFIYDLVEDKYCSDNGRPSIDLVMLIKLVLIQYLYGIKSMRQTVKDIEIERLIADAGYKTPAIAKLLIDAGIQPVFPYKRPSTKKGFFKSMSMLMTNTMTVTFVRTIRY